jgi:spermidine/putrescine transport system substrate-binding protein
MLLRLLTVLAVCVSLVSALGATRVEKRVEKQLHVLIWSDYIDPEIVKTFESANGCKVTLDVYEETEAMLAKLSALKGETKAGGYDVVIASDHSIPVLEKLGLIRKLDLTQVPNAKNVAGRFQKPAYDPAGNWSLPYQWGTAGILYNKKKFTTPPSLKTMLSGHAPGRFLLLDSPRDTLGLALKQIGQSVNTKDPAKLKVAGKLVALAKGDPKFVGFDGSVSSAKRVVAGQADLALAYNGDALNAMKEKPGEFDYVVPAEGSILWVDTMVIPANAPDSALAHAFLNFVLAPETGAKLSNYINYATPNAAALPQIAADAKADPRIYPTEETIKTLEYLEDVGGSTRLFDEIWTAIKAR